MYDILGEVCPTVVLSTVDAASCTVLAACVVLSQDAPDDVQAQVCSLSRQVFKARTGWKAQMFNSEDSRVDQEDKDRQAALLLRKLRARQQVLQDVVLVGSSVHGGNSLATLLLAVLEGSVCAYSGLAYLSRKMRMTEDEPEIERRSDSTLR